MYIIDYFKITYIKLTTSVHWLFMTCNCQYIEHDVDSMTILADIQVVHSENIGESTNFVTLFYTIAVA